MFLEGTNYTRGVWWGESIVLLCNNLGSAREKGTGNGITNPI